MFRTKTPRQAHRIPAHNTVDCVKCGLLTHRDCSSMSRAQAESCRVTMSVSRGQQKVVNSRAWARMFCSLEANSQRGERNAVWGLRCCSAHRCLFLHFQSLPVSLSVWASTAQEGGSRRYHVPTCPEGPAGSLDRRVVWSPSSLSALRHQG